MPVEAMLTPPGEKTLGEASSTEPKIRLFSTGRVFEIRNIEVQVLPASVLHPDKVLFAAVHDPSLRVKEPIPLGISVEKGIVVAHSPELEEFGYGSSLSEALADFGKTVKELYWSLESHADRLGEDLKKIREVLHKYIEARPRPK